jgi:hypothetical protein
MEFGSGWIDALEPAHPVGGGQAPTKPDPGRGRRPAALLVSPCAACYPASCRRQTEPSMGLE